MLKFNSIEYNKTDFDIYDSSKKLIINWYPMLVCNYRCPYCFMSDKLLKTKPYEVDLNILDEFKDFKLPINFGIAGGELTLITNFKELYKKCSDLKSEKLNFRFISNGSFCNNSLEIANSGNIEWLLTFHPHSANINKFIDNIKKLKDQFTIRVMLIPESRFIKYYDFFKDFENAENVQFELLFDSYNNFDNKFLKYLENGLKIKYKIGNKDYTREELIKNKLNNFKMCKCYINQFQFFNKDKIVKSCSNKIYTLDELKEWDLVKPEICKLNKCSIGSHLEFSKILFRSI